MISRIRMGIMTAALLVPMFMPTISAHAATLVPGDLIKGPGEAVYYYGQNNKRYVFPSIKTFITWYTSFDTVKTISSAELGAIPLGGNVTHRPGVRLVKITTDPKVYAVAANGTLRWIQTEQIARDLYGSNWNTKVDDIADSFFVNYRVGEPIVSAAGFSPAGETARAATINADKQLSVNGPPQVMLSVDKQMVAAGEKATLTIGATFLGTGTFTTAVLKNNNSVSKYCTTLPCTLQSDPLAAGSTNTFTAEVTDSNGMTGKSTGVTVTVPAGSYY